MVQVVLSCMASSYSADQDVEVFGLDVELVDLGLEEARLLDDMSKAKRVVAASHMRDFLGLG